MYLTGSLKKSIKNILSILLMITILIGVMPSTNLAYGNSENIVDDNGNEMYSVPVTLYDYKSNSEIDKGYVDNYYEGAGQFNGFNHYSFESLNVELSKYFKANSMNYPLYFGDLNIGTASIKGNNFYNFYWAPNRANVNAGYSAVVQGLVDQELKDGAISQNGIPLPYFNEKFLTETMVNSKSIGTVVNTRFPFRKTNDKGVTYYEFDSTNGQDNVWLENGKLKYSSDSNAHGVWDANHLMANAASDGLGFFPLNDRAKEGENSSRSQLNFGFGLKMDIKFTIPKGGVIEGTDGINQDIVFEFTGDDDVWIFIDGKLVLDLGGQHKKSYGMINFNSAAPYSKVDKVVNGSITGNTSQPVKDGEKINLIDLGLDFSDPSQEHTLTMYYMERGMIESNMKVRYNFFNVNKLDVTKEIDNTDVNYGLTDAVNEVTSKEEFGITLNKVVNDKNLPISNTEYKTSADINKTTDENGKFQLKDKETAKFVGAFENEDYLRLKEDDTDRYSTKVKIVNENNEEKVIEGNDTDVFKYNNQSIVSKNSIIFTNKIKTGSLSLTKEVTKYVEDYFGNYKDDEFTFQIKIKNLFGDEKDTEYKGYNLSYTLNGQSLTATNGIITLKAGDKAIINGIPVGTMFSIEEVGYPNRYKLEDKINNAGIIEEGIKDSVFTNGAASEVYNLILRKTIDEKYYPSDDDFTCNENYSGLTDAEQSFLFKITQYDKPASDNTRQVVNVFYEVISFSNGDPNTKERVIKNLPKGYYEVAEDTDWSWKYEFQSVMVNPAGISNCKDVYATAIDIGLGYEIKSDPIVSFINYKKFTDKEHEEIPEGDTAIESNTLKKE